MARQVDSRKVKCTAGEIGRVRVIEDFLPAPDALVPREENVKVTLSLSRRSVDFFKRAAKARRVPYQRMIRALVDAYAEKQDGKYIGLMVRSARRARLEPLRHRCGRKEFSLAAHHGCPGQARA
jgi:predicted DNA binding CopG/RHH family protein